MMELLHLLRAEVDRMRAERAALLAELEAARHRIKQLEARPPETLAVRA